MCRGAFWLLVLCVVSCLWGCAGQEGTSSSKKGALLPLGGLWKEDGGLGEVMAAKTEGTDGTGEPKAEGTDGTGEPKAEGTDGTGEPKGEEQQSMEAKLQFYLDSMTLEEKAAQLFVVLPESLISGVGTVTAAGNATKEALENMPVGGFIYMEKNLKSREQITEMLGNVQDYSRERIGLPAFLCVDEEGGTVARINGRGIVDAPVIGDMSDVGREGSPKEAYEIGRQLGISLSQLGFNVDFAPVADVWSNPENQVVEKRSFGSDPQVVSGMSLAVSEGLNDQGVLSCYKHFPGHGATAGDTHAGYAYTDKSLEELKDCELIPFQEGIRGQVPIIMVGHISLPRVTGDDTPASLSYRVITELLREEMGYDGLVVTDALNMKAIVQQYSPAQAAVMTLQAGADLILMPQDFWEAYNGILEAVEDGTLTEERIDESLERILRVKLTL